MELADVVILCGGRGTRLQEHAPSIPKPLVEIGNRPILWHVIQIYASQGFDRVVLCTGYKGGSIRRFLDSHSWPEGVRIEGLGTAPDPPTGRPIHPILHPAAGR